MMMVMRVLVCSHCYCHLSLLLLLLLYQNVMDDDPQGESRLSGLKEADDEDDYDSSWCSCYCYCYYAAASEEDGLASDLDVRAPRVIHLLLLYRRCWKMMSDSHVMEMNSKELDGSSAFHGGDGVDAPLTLLNLSYYISYHTMIPDCHALNLRRPPPKTAANV